MKSVVYDELGFADFIEEIKEYELKNITTKHIFKDCSSTRVVLMNYSDIPNSSDNVIALRKNRAVEYIIECPDKYIDLAVNI